MEIKLKKGVVLVDDDFFDNYPDIHVYIRKGRAVCYLKGNSRLKFSLSRFVLQVHKKDFKSSGIIDHIDRNPLNNLKENLRFCTHSQNNKNRNPRGSSRFLGVSLHRRYCKYTKKNGELVEKTYTKWQATIKIGEKYKHLGLYDNEIEAAMQYDKFAKMHHKEFANLNFNEPVL